MKFPLLLVLWALSLTGTAAYADTLQTFTYSGTFARGTVSGNITIDITTGAKKPCCLACHKCHKDAVEKTKSRRLPTNSMFCRGA
jgi:cytochrome c553